MKKSIVIIAVVTIIVILIIVILESNNSVNTDLHNNVNQVDNNQNNAQVNGNLETLNEESGSVDNKSENIKINLTVNNKTFSATLENNETTRELTQMFPMTIQMSDLNSNEKYNYLDTNLTTNASRVSRINAGDIKLFGSNCLVVFYESFNTSYSYTNLGKVDNANDFVNELGRGSVTVTFELAE